ncbi:MAG: RNA polymerase sigma factor, partial [Frankia sp.]
MSTLMHVGPSDALVVAARDGDRRAQDALIRHCSPLVYNIVGRALDGHADTDGVVQETFRRMVRYLPDLRDPAAFRSWLVAIAVRVVSDHERSAAPHRRAELYPGPDPAGDFAGLTIWSLGLADQRREVAEATRWVDADDRVLLSVWWLAQTGDLTREDVGRALAQSVPHPEVHIRRMEGQITQARAVLRALAADPPCRALGDVAERWDGRPDPLWRTRLDHHVQDCRWCRVATGGLWPAATLLAGLPLVPVPAVSAPVPAVSAAFGPAAPGGPG